MRRILRKIYILFRKNILIFVLLAITVIALLTHQYGLNDITYLNLSNYAQIFPQTDSADGGYSTVNIQRTDSSIIMDYELKEGYAYPYAGVRILLSSDVTNGWDLSNYDSIFVWMKPRGEGAVRIYMRTYDPDFYRKGDESSLKFNELEFFPVEESYPAVFVPQEFRVAGWWAAQNEINVHKARVDLSNVPFIEIQTGTEAPLGYGTLEIKGFCFKGKLIPKVDLVTIIVACWFISFLTLLIIRFFEFNKERTTNRQKREELEKNLKALEIEKSEFEKSSKSDPLTGCLNRAGFSSILMKEQDNLNQNGVPVSFVILDIDHFKHINDTYGHAVGDEVLVNLTKLIQNKIRNTDSLVRWGGEEFVIFCEDTKLQNANFLAEKLRIAIENTPLIMQQQVTCSFGVAEMVAGEDPKRLFERADKALYTSKESGRNRVTSAPSP